MAEKESKAPDYSESAENLCNPEQVLTELLAFKKAMTTLNGLKKELETLNPELFEAIEAQMKVVEDVTMKLKASVDEFGSYQDIEAKNYAVKFRRMSKIYHVEPFKRRYERFVSAVIEETINVKALEGLVKGGLISSDDLKHPDIGVITETPTYAYFIR